MRLKFCFSILLTCLFINLSAQKIVFENLRNYSRKGSGGIYQAEQLVGYYTFLLFDKVDKEHENYKLSILDNNLNEVKHIDIVRPKNSFLESTDYNGKNLVCGFNVHNSFSFANDDGREYLSLDSSLNEVGKITESYKADWQKMRISKKLNTFTANSYFVGMGENAFIRHSYVKTENNLEGYLFTAYDNQLHELWNYASDNDSVQMAEANILFINDKVVALVIQNINFGKSTVPGKLIKLLDAKTGKTIYEKVMIEDSKDFYYTSLIFNYDDATKESVVFGEYKNKKDISAFIPKTTGTFVMKFDASGGEISKKKYPWTEMNTIKKNMENPPKKGSSNMQVQFHRVFMSKDHRLFVVGEQYDLTNVYDMVLLEFNKDLELITYNLYPKTKRILNSRTDPGQIGEIHFDYQFTSIDRKRDIFVSIYTDENAKASQRKTNQLYGAIKFDGQNVRFENFTLTTEADNIDVYPAKPGYIQVNEYDRGNKTLTIRLEKVVY